MKLPFNYSVSFFQSCFLSILSPACAQLRMLRAQWVCAHNYLIQLQLFIFIPSILFFINSINSVPSLCACSVHCGFARIMITTSTSFNYSASFHQSCFLYLKYKYETPTPINSVPSLCACSVHCGFPRMPAAVRAGKPHNGFTASFLCCIFLLLICKRFFTWFIGFSNPILTEVHISNCGRRFPPDSLL